MKESTGWQGAAIATAGALVAGFGATVAANWPGHLSFDSIVQLWEGRAGVYNTWHPPVMAWLLGLFDAVVPGAGLFIVFDAALAFGALLALLSLGRARWWSGALAAGIALLPQMILYQGLVWKDVLFADTALAAFVSLAVAVGRTRRARAAWLLASFLLLVLAAMTRQNGMIAVPFAAAALGWIAVLQGETSVRAAVAGTVLLVAVLALASAANSLLDLRSNGDSGPAEQLHVLALYDLSGAAARSPGLEMDALADDDPALETAIRSRGAKLYSPLRVDSILSDPQVQAALADADLDALVAQWRALIFRHTGLYLSVRLADFAQVFLTPDIAAARPVFTGVEGPARELTRMGIAPRRDARDRALEGYGKSLFGTPVWSHLAFAVLALACLVVLLRRRRPPDIAIAAMLFSAFAFAASFFIISISCDYRYLFYLDLSALAALFYVSLDRREAA